MQKKRYRGIGYSFMIMASVVIVLAGVKSASVIIVPLLLALFIAVAISPFYLWLQAKGLPQGLALVSVIVVLFTIIGTLVMFFGSSIQSFTHNAPVYEQKLRTDLLHYLSVIESKGITIPKDDILNMFATDSIIEYIAKTLRSLGSLLTNSFMILITVIFMLMEISEFSKKIEAINSPRLLSLLDVSTNIKQFILLKSMTSAATGVLIAIALKVIGIDYAMLWGLVAFLLNFIPNIGSIIAALPAVLMALIQYDMKVVLVVMAVYLVVNVVIGSILEPRIMGRGLGLSPLIVFLSLVFWGWLLGPVGMLLSIPLTIMVKIILDASEDTRWISKILGN